MIKISNRTISGEFYSAAGSIYEEMVKLRKSQEGIFNWAPPQIYETKSLTLKVSLYVEFFRPSDLGHFFRMRPNLKHLLRFFYL